MTNKTIKGAITSINLKGSTATIILKAEIQDVAIDEIKELMDINLELIIHDSQASLDEFADEEESGGKD